MPVIAALADVHTATGDTRCWEEILAPAARSDALLLGGDFIRSGDYGGLERFLRVVHALALPTVAVLGNHDFSSERGIPVTTALVQAGVTLLTARAPVWRPPAECLRLTGLVVAGVPGQGGGFTDADETRHHRLAAVAHRQSQALHAGLAGIAHARWRIVLTHYAPCVATIAGVAPPRRPLAGSRALEEVVDHHRPEWAIHGHAHPGPAEGRTRGGVAVRNVALPLTGRVTLLPLCWPTR